ncbi:ABC transporter permease [Hypnocyclicus thermotrophus]|uniref:ABC transporter permease n=1 Tax=Hypnocyclicus thermotrophus TaxID=1627895 RepID=UPI0014170D20|nr:iron ABC transporter permease [Hypnocyclicus thermotrophus]
MFDYIKNTFILSLFSSLFSAIIGYTLAYFTVFYDFRYRKLFDILFILPLAIPTYIAGYVYGELFSFTGLFKGKIDIMNIYGGIFIFSIFLAPYVYIISKSYLSKISSNIIENAKILGKNDLHIFLNVLLPMSRIALVSSVSLVTLEIINAYGVVKYFGINTFSIGIFRTWFSLGDSNSAIKLAAFLMFTTFIVLSLEKNFRKHKNYSYINSKIKSIKRKKLSKSHEFIITIFSLLYIIIGFIFPIIQLVYFSMLTYKMMLNYETFLLIFKTFILTAISSLITLIIALIISNNARLSKNKFSGILARISSIGYSIPGAVIAIGVLMLFITIDNFFDTYFSMSFIVLILAYIIRFLGVGYNTINTSFLKIGLKFHESARTLGKSKIYTFFKIDFPMIKSSIFSAYILIFIEIIKELPLTLILRPFNFDTLSTITKKYVEDEMIYHSGIPSLIIVFICFLGIIYFNILNKNRRN